MLTKVNKLVQRLLFSYYISIPAKDPATEGWLKANSDQSDAFVEWANEQLDK